MTPQVLVGYLYTAVISGLAVYALHITALIALYLWHRRTPSPSIRPIAEADLPTVTVQIPLRNERYVVQRILQAVAALDWPRDDYWKSRFWTTQPTTPQYSQKQKSRSCKNWVIKSIFYHRQHPEGHKAGALAAGLQHTQ